MNEARAVPALDPGTTNGRTLREPGRGGGAGDRAPEAGRTRRPALRWHRGGSAGRVNSLRPPATGCTGIVNRLVKTP